MSKIKYNNAAFTYEPKFKDPATNIDDHEHRGLVPAIKRQKGVNVNYIIVTCSPSYNGVYSWNPKTMGPLKTGKNGKLDIYYVPLEKCNFVCKLDELEFSPEINKYFTNKIKEQQKAGINGEVKYHPYIYQEVPEWCLPGVKLKKQQITTEHTSVPEVESKVETPTIKPTTKEQPKVEIQVYQIQLW